MDSDTLNISPLKFCNSCKQWKPATIENFDTHPTGKYGLSHKCKVCRAAYRRQRRIEKGDQIRASEQRQRDLKREHVREVSRRYHEANREHFRQVGRDYYRTHKEVSRNYRRKSYHKHRDTIQEKHRQYKSVHNAHLMEMDKRYRMTHKMEGLAQGRKRRARLRGIGGTHTAQDVLQQFKRQKGKCYYCGTKLHGKYDVDHIIPITREGSSNDPWNLVITCCPCNRRKHNKLPHEWPEGGRLL